MNLRREKLEQWINDLKDSGKLIIVEGQNDKTALDSFGIQNVVVMNTGRTITQIVEELSKDYSEVIILTDLDSEGKKLYKRLKKEFSEMGFKVDNYFREFLFNTQLTHIEGLVGYLHRL